MVEIDPMYHLINTIIDDKEVVLLLGPGASREGKQKGQRFPGTDELMEAVLKKFGPVPKTKKKRLDLFLTIIGEWEKEKTLSTRLSKYLEGEAGAAHYYLAALSIALFGDSNALLYLTTNYDDLIGKAFTDLERNPERKFKTVFLPLRPRMTGSEFQEMVGNIDVHLKGGRPVILKLFGDLNSHNPILRQDKMTFEPEIEKILVEWMKKPMIIIGYSFPDKTLKELLIAARGTSPVFLVNPGKKIPPIIKDMDRVYHIKRSFSDFISGLLEIIKERNPSISKKIDNILEFLGSLPELPGFQAAKDTSKVIAEPQVPYHEAAAHTGSPVQPQEEGLYMNSWALVIGINHYKHESIPDLNFAENDAKAVASCLPALGFPKENIKLLVGEQNQVTREVVLDILETEINPKMDEDDRFLFYFAGHGVTYEANKQRRGYILLQNSKIYGEMPGPANPYLKKIPARSLEMHGFLDIVQSLPGKHKLLLIDSCFSGFMTHTREISERMVIDIDKKLGQWTMFPVTQVLTAGRSGQKSVESEFYQHGVFTWYLLNGLQGNADLRGDGIISFLDLANYIRDRVSQEKDVVQDPQVGTFGEGQFVFLYGNKAQNKLSPGVGKFDGVSRELSPDGAEASKTYEVLFGRDEEMDAVISLLSDKNKPALINIYGLGGVGKTSLVREMLEIKQPGRVVWLTAKKHYFEGDELYRNPLTESITLQQVYRKIATSFGQHYLEELAVLKEKAKRIQWLQNLLTKEKRLVVVDNFETIDEDFKQFLAETRPLFSAGPSRMVITSRFDLKKYPFIYNYKLNGLSENDTLALFSHELEKSDEGASILIDKKELTNIYAVTRGLPLAVKLIAARIRSSDIGALDYILERLQNIEFTNEEEIYERFYKFIYLDTWNSLSDQARSLLVLMSALAAGEEITISYLRRIGVEAVNEQMSQNAFWESFEEIKKYSLVDTRKSDPSVFSLHPLTQSFIKAEILQMDEYDEFKNF